MSESDKSEVKPDVVIKNEKSASNSNQFRATRIVKIE